MVTEEMQNPHAPRHFQLRFNLHRRLNPQPEIKPYTVSVRKCGTHIRRRRQRKRLNRESCGHILCPSGVDLAGGNEHEPDLATGIEELKGAVVVRESSAVRVSNGGVLGESEINGAVND